MASASLAAIRERHRHWLGRHDLLGQPWFVLGSAPEPTIPRRALQETILVCINNSGATAAQLGLPPARLTVRNRNKEWASVAGLQIPLVLWLSDKNRFQVYWTRLLKARSRLGEIRTIPTQERYDICTSMLGNDLLSIGAMNKTSTGIFAAVYGLFLGVPEVILGGISVDKDGYSYSSAPGVQRHRTEDSFALKTLASRGEGLRTAEADLAAKMGIPLYS